MKKTAILCSLLLLSACIKAGGWDIWPERNVWAESFQTLPIIFYDQSMRPVKSELLTERSFPVNRVLSANVGYSMVDDKIYRKIYYAQEVVRANMDGGLVSGTYPVEYKKGQELSLFGEVVIDGTLYALISAGDKDFYALVDGQGNLYHRIGQVRHDRLALLNTSFVVYPTKFSFEPVTLSKAVQTSPIDGYDIKYGGLKAGYVSFVYYRYDAPSNDGLHDSGEFEVISFPAKQSLINIRGVKLKILEAKKESIDYMIIEK